MDEQEFERDEQLLEARRLKRLEDPRRRKMQQRMVLGLLAFSVMFVCRRGLRKAKARLDKGIFPHRKKR
mgnify:CR=1 FL=1